MQRSSVLAPPPSERHNIARRVDEMTRGRRGSALAHTGDGLIGIPPPCEPRAKNRGPASSAEWRRGGFRAAETGGNVGERRDGVQWQRCCAGGSKERKNAGAELLDPRERSFPIIHRAEGLPPLQWPSGPLLSAFLSVWPAPCLSLCVRWDVIQEPNFSDRAAGQQDATQGVSRLSEGVNRVKPHQRGESSRTGGEMKPDGVDTTAPMEALGAEPVMEGPAGEEELQQVAPPTLQPEEEAKQQEQQPEAQTAPPAPKEGSRKPTDPKAKTKGPTKTKPGTAGAKTTGTSGPGARPGVGQNRLLNGVQKPLANGVAKKATTTTTALEKKKPTTTTTAPKRPVGLGAAPPARPPVKVADRKPVGAPRPATAPSGTGGAKTGAAAAAQPNKKVSTAPVNGVKAKPRTTAPRPASAVPSKPSTAAAPTRTDRPTVPKTTRPAGVLPAPRPAPTTTAAKPGATSARPASSRAGATAPSAGRSAAAQPTKTTAPAKKDVSRPTTAPPKKLAVAPTRSLATKPSKPESPKPATAAAARPGPTTKRPAASGKAAEVKPLGPRPKPQDAGKPPASGDVKASPRPATAPAPRPGLTKASTATPKRQVGSTAPLAVKRGPKPTQPVQPLATGGEPAKKTQTPKSPAAATAAVVTVAAAATAAAVAMAAAGLPAQAGVEIEAAGLPAQQPDVPAAVVTLLGTTVPSVLTCRPGVLSPGSAGPASQPKEEPLAAVAAALSSLPQEREEAVEKADEENNEEEEEEEEEEREGSQQVSVSDMSGTQPTEESRPGSAGLAGSMWRGGALMSELDSEEPEGSGRGSPDIDTVPDIPANDEEEEDDDDDQVYDMEVGSERAEDVRRVRHEGEEEEDDEDVEMASEGVTESGLESYGNADEDDFAEDDRLDNLNRAQPPPPLLPAALPAQWSQTNPFADPWARPPQPAADLLASPTDPWPADPETPTQSPAQVWLELSTATLVAQTDDPFARPQAPPASVASEPQPAPVEQEAPKATLAPPPTRGMSQSSTLSGTELAAQSSSDTSTPEELRDYNSSSGVESRSEGKQQEQRQQQAPRPIQQPDLEQDLGIHLERGDGEEEEEEAETLPADEVPGGPATAPVSAPSSPSSSGDEASDTEGEMQINEPDGRGIDNMAFDGKPGGQSLPALEEREGEADGEEGGDTPQSANSVASYAFDCTTSNSNAHSTAESCGKSPGIFSLENEDQLPDEAKDPSLIKELTLPAAANVDADDLAPGAPVHLLPLGRAEEARSNPDEQQYMLCGKTGAELMDQSAAGGPLPQDAGLLPLSSHTGDAPDTQPPYYSAICEKTDTVLSGGHERNGRQRQEEARERAAPRKQACLLPFDHVSQPRPPADLPLSAARTQPTAQLRRLEQHQQQLLQIQQGRDRQRQLEEEQRQKSLQKDKEEEEEEEEGVKEEEEERQRQEQQRQLEQQRQDLLHLQLHLQQQQQQEEEEQKHRQQILQWQRELEEQQRQQQQQQHHQQQHKAQSAVLLSPSSGLCTIYEAMETSDEEEEEEEEEEGIKELAKGTGHKTEERAVEKAEDGGDSPSRAPLASPSSDPPEQLELDWTKKVDIVQQLINETLLLAGDGCTPLLLLPGGGGGTLSPLESSLWPSLLPPLTPPSATVTSVSSFSPEDQGSSPQGEWTVVELETHH
ncbi:hypothetical protein AAFF_G00239180 [Aldrovandia affinis]|uniref:BTB/POZ domain-containing protein n=1 Tax=Aldrovandia affinis TaxID=143900 RepID=A0AAD7REC7_9TELE|nr:hypothetical protein AAFF_G00239180 [Aldrovandia affinis]